MKAEKSIFLDVFGDSPVNRVMDFLMVHEDFDYSMRSIAKHSRIGYSTLKLILPQLESAGIVLKTRGVGNAKMFTLNIENHAVKQFKKFYWAVTKQITDLHLEEESGIKVKSKV